MNTLDAIEILSRDGNGHYRLERAFAVATLSAWLNSPESISDRVSVVFAAINHAVLDARKNEYNPPNEWLGIVYDADSYLKPDEIPLTTAMFWFLDLHLAFNHCRYVADISRFLITFQTKSLDKRKRASLGKAWDFINKHGGYSHAGGTSAHKAYCSLSTHQVIWRDYKQTAPFQCARFYGSKFDWYIDPRSKNFLTQLQETAGRVEEIRQFLGEARYLQERLKDVLDPRSMSEAEYFQFPKSIEPRKCKLPPMTASAYGRMASYRNSSGLKLQQSH